MSLELPMDDELSPARLGLRRLVFHLKCTSRRRQQCDGPPHSPPIADIFPGCHHPIPSSIFRPTPHSALLSSVAQQTQACPSWRIYQSTWWTTPCSIARMTACSATSRKARQAAGFHPARVWSCSTRFGCSCGLLFRAGDCLEVEGAKSRVLQSSGIGAQMQNASQGAAAAFPEFTEAI